MPLDNFAYNKVQESGGVTKDEGLAVSDVILSISGTDVHSKVDFNECMKKYKSGDSPAFIIRRGADEMTLWLTLF